MLHSYKPDIFCYYQLFILYDFSPLVPSALKQKVIFQTAAIIVKINQS